MPQNRRAIKAANGVITHVKPASKLKIGTRSSGVSANLMSTDALKEVINNKDKARYHSKARTVLLNRGVRLDWHEPLVASADDNADTDMQADTAA